MGCGDSRADSGSVEAAILKGEDSLKWNKVTSKKAITAFEHRGDNSLSDQQLRVALGDFGADNSWIDSPESELFKVFDNFRDGQKFDAKKLKLLAILIGKGNAKDKANFLFDVSDTDCNESLTREEVS